MATARKKNRAKAPAKSSKTKTGLSSNGSKAMAGKKPSGKAGIKALLTAIRGKPKASESAKKSKPKAAAAKPAKAKTSAPAKGKKVVSPSPKAASAKSTKASAAQKSAPTKDHGKNGAAVAVKAVPQVQAKGKGKQSGAGKNSAAIAAAAVVQKVTARLAGRTSLEATTEAVCREVACEGLGTTAGYCRLHYIKNWRKIKRKEVILREGKLNVYIEELVAKYPEKYLEAIRHDLTNDKEFAKVIHDLDLDESIDDFEGEGSDSDAVIDTIKREFDDDTETF